jgi:hypothetical protein
LGKGVHRYEEEHERISVHLARNTLFSLISGLHPVVLEHLSGEPFEAFVKAIPDTWKLPTYYHDFKDRYLRAFQSLFKVEDLKPTALALRETLSKWTLEYNLTANWCRERAILTLFYWRDNPTARQRLEWKYVFPYRFPVLTLQDAQALSEKFWDSRDGSVFGHQYWEPNDEWLRRSEYEQRLREHFESRLKAYLDQIEALAEARGYVKQPESDFPRKHYVMLIYYQVIGRDPERIELSSGARSVEFAELPDAKKASALLPFRESEANFYKAIERLSKFIGLKLRRRTTTPK